MPPKEYVPGDTVFAKLKGYPWWPARVEDDNEIPAKVLKQKTKTKTPLYTVFFYGSRDYGFFGPDCIRPFDRETVENDLKAKKFKTKDLEHAVHQALDPSILKEEEEAERREEEEEEEKRKKKAAAGRKKTAVTKKTSSSSSSSPAVTKKKAATAQKKTAENNNSNNNNNNKRVNKRASSEDPSEADRKKRRKSLSTEQEEDNASLKGSPTLLRKSEEPQQHNGTDKAALDLEVFKKTPEYKKVYHARHRLQKQIYEKKPGEIAKEEHAKISQVVKEIEDMEMTYDLLRYTKIGKVVKFGCGYTFEDDEHDIQARCLQLMKRWKNVLVVETERHAAEQQQDATPQTSNGNHA